MRLARLASYGLVTSLFCCARGAGTALAAAPAASTMTLGLAAARSAL